MSEQAGPQSNQGRTVAVFFGVLLGLAGMVWFVQQFAPEESPASNVRATATVLRSTGPQATVTSAPVRANFSGSSQTATQAITMRPGLARFEMEHSGSGNFAIWLLNSQGAKQSLLVNEIGSFKGSKAVQIERAGDYLFDVKADGPWKLTVQQ